MNRARDWLYQAERDLEMAEVARGVSRHEWACFAAQQAAEKAVKALYLHIPGLLALGYFGSYARGDYGVGSDLDLLFLVESSSLPPWQRVLDLPLEELPVPTEALVYTLAEWQALPQRSPRFAETLRREARWLLCHPTLSLP